MCYFDRTRRGIVVVVKLPIAESIVATVVVCWKTVKTVAEVIVIGKSLTVDAALISNSA